MTDTVRLRPHHLLCFQFFAGYGYSDDFNVNTARIITLLECHDAPQIIIVNGADDVCACCPRHEYDERPLTDKCEGQGCMDADIISALDSFTLTMTKLNIGDRGKYTDFRDLAFEKVIQNGKYRMVCKRCQWYHICKNNAVILLEKHAAQQYMGLGI